MRNHLLDIAENIAVSNMSQLTFRETMALWQLQRFGEGRAFVHVDRLATSVSSEPTRRASLEVLAQNLFEGVAGDPDPAARRRPILERLTLPGRAVLLGALVAGGTTFYGAVVFLYESLPGMRLPLLLPLLIGLLAAGGFLWVGARVLRRRRTAFLVEDTKRWSQGDLRGDAEARAQGATPRNPHHS